MTAAEARRVVGEMPMRRHSSDLDPVRAPHSSEAPCRSGRSHSLGLDPLRDHQLCLGATLEPTKNRRARGAERGAEAPPSARGPRDSPAACETRAAPAPFCATGPRRRPGLDSRYHGRVGGRRRGPAPYGERAARPLRPGAAGRGSDVVDGQEFV